MSDCPQTQCQSAEPKTLHAGYVRHRNQGELPCFASNTGHNAYMKIQRERKAARAASTREDPNGPTTRTSDQ